MSHTALSTIENPLEQLLCYWCCIRACALFCGLLKNWGVGLTNCAAYCRLLPPFIANRCGTRTSQPLVLRPSRPSSAPVGCVLALALVVLALVVLVLVLVLVVLWCCGAGGSRVLGQGPWWRSPAPAIVPSPGSSTVPYPSTEPSTEPSTAQYYLVPVPAPVRRRLQY